MAIPLARVTDWPDLAERGLWGGSAERDIGWMAGHKMNLVESRAALGMTDDRHGRAEWMESLAAADVGKSLQRLGIRNVLGPYLREEIGKWVTDDNGSVWIKGRLPDQWRSLIDQAKPLTD